MGEDKLQNIINKTHADMRQARMTENAKKLYDDDGERMRTCVSCKGKFREIDTMVPAWYTRNQRVCMECLERLSNKRYHRA
jgi:hypothetical protein